MKSTAWTVAAVLAAIALVVTSVLFELRLLNYIVVSWWVVISPLWAPVFLCWAGVQCMLVAYAVAEIRNWLDKWDE